jgi:hypothetical protein
MQRREFMILAGGTAMLPLAALAQHGWPEFPRRGGLTGYGPDLAEQYLLSGVYMCGRILKGGKASRPTGGAADQVQGRAQPQDHESVGY